MIARRRFPPAQPWTCYRPSPEDDLLQGLIFLGLALLVVGPIHWYLWRRLVKDTTRPGRGRKLATFGFLLLPLMLLSALILPRVVGAKVSFALSLGGYLWLALLFYQRQDPQGSTTAFFPLFGYFHDKATDASAFVTPLGGYRSGPRDTTGLILTFYWRSYKAEGGGTSGWNAGLFPLFFFGRNKDTAHAIVFPLFWHLANKDSSTTALLPLFYWHRDAKGYAFGTPVFYMGDRGGESYAVQFPLFWHFASERRDTRPNHTMTRGTSATLGIAWNMMMSG